MSRFLICSPLSTAPGDQVVLSALIRDLHHLYGRKHDFYVRTHHPDLWIDNPYVCGVNVDEKGMQHVGLVMQNWVKAARDGKYSGHYLTAYHAAFRILTQLDVRLTTAKPDLHVPQSSRLFSQPYWVIAAGCRDQMTTKLWPQEYWQQLVDYMNGCGMLVVQVGQVDSHHTNYKLDGVTSVVGRTSLMDLCNLVRHSAGVVCSITSLMHIAAAYEKRCVVIAGAREGRAWEHYTNDLGNFGDAVPVTTPHEFLTSYGSTLCAGNLNGCWKRYVTAPANPRPDGSDAYRMCLEPTGEPRIAECMRKVLPKRVIEALRLPRPGIEPGSSL